MTTPWAWTRRFAVSLTVSVAAFSAWGALAPHIPMPSWVAAIAAGGLMAALYGNAQGLANCMAANTRRAWTAGKGFRLPALFFAVCFVVFAAISMSGLHSAWAFVRAHADGAPLPDDALMRILFTCIAFSEPAMNYGIEAMRALQHQQQRAEERDDLNDAVDRETRRHGAETRRRGLHVIAPMAAATIATAPIAAEGAALPWQSEAHVPFATAAHAAPADPTEEAHASHGWNGPRDAVKWRKFLEATELGLAPMAIVREARIPSTTVYRWRRLLAAKASDVG